MKPETTLKEGRIYINKKTGARYRIRCFAKAAWDAEQTLIVYSGSIDSDDVWVRSLNEFKEKFDEE